MTVEENVGFPLKMRGIDKASSARRVREVLDVVGLPHIGQRLPSALSGGQQQRVALARAVIFQPSLLLMDEPLGALDKRMREVMQLEIMRLHRTLGTTILYVTHDQEEAMVMSDRIAVFNHGSIEQFATPNRLYERPKTEFVASFVGDTCFIRGIVRKRSGDLTTIQATIGEFVGLDSGRCAVGQKGVLAIRPERVNIGEPTPDCVVNCASGLAKRIINYGPWRKVIVQLANGDQLTSLLHAKDFEALSIVEGERIGLWWEQQNSTVFQSE
jgi:putative spermidine/putrescine transport system ATP-binding protein